MMFCSDVLSYKDLSVTSVWLLLCEKKKSFSIFLSAVMSSRVFKLQVKSDSDETKYSCHHPKLVTGKDKAMLGDSEKTLTI